MNAQEFKAWFAGFIEGMDGMPNPDQWKRVQEEVCRLTPLNVPSLTNPFTPNSINPGTHRIEPRYLLSCDPIPDPCRITCGAVP